MKGKPFMKKEWKWMHKSSLEERDDGLMIHAPAQSDYFVDPSTQKSTCNAPFLYQEMEGDFILRAKLHHDFSTTYDACVLMAYDHEKLWAKACFEYTDTDEHAIVTVMTNERSDDANNAVVHGDEVWLQLSRKDHIFAVHYSLDGESYRMARISYLPMKKTIRVGLVAQSPTGKGGMRYFEHITLEKRTLHDIRNGNA